MPKASDIPACPGMPAIRSSGRETRVYPIRLITPMFGGGVEAGEPDATLPIRGTSIRGQLQFWWRATRGAGCATREELFKRHAEVWGTTERASPVEIEVRDAQAAALRPSARYEWNQQARKGQGGWRLSWESPFRNTALPYALFPFQGQPPPRPTRDAEPEELPARFIENGSFTLRVRFPEKLREEVQTAVWAWVNFGGLGARTRRGCGSLSCEELAPKDIGKIAEWMETAGPIAGALRTWPTFPASLLIRPEANDPVVVWDWMIGRYRYFRQGEPFARNPGQGRSRFPEPETIRRITGQRFEKHEAWDDMPDGFPRAELGLPIVFHFKDENLGEPRQTTLNPFVGGVALERMASPLILKPLALAGRKAVPLILRLTTDEIKQVELQDKNKKCLTPRHMVPVRDRSFAQSGSPLHGLSSSGSALDAFVSFAQHDSGFQEITR
jgi:CRISPR-associated protein Cmr1